MGLVVAFAITFAVEWVNARIHPLPPGTDYRDPVAMRAAMALLPRLALVMVLLGWFLSALAGSWVAARIAGQARVAFVLGILLLAAALGNTMMFPHPVWFWIATVLLYPLATYFGARLGAPWALRTR